MLPGVQPSGRGCWAHVGQHLLCGVFMWDSWQLIIVLHCSSSPSPFELPDISHEWSLPNHFLPYAITWVPSHAGGVNGHFKC